MCDFFWLSPADQGDLSNVVRASLQQPTPPHRRLEGDELLLLQGVNCGDHDHHQVPLQPEQQQLVHGDGMGFMVSSNSGSSCDHAVSSPSYPQPSLQPEGLIHQLMSRPPPQLDVEVAPEMDEHGSLDMAMAPHPHAPAIKRRKSQTKKVVCIPAAAPAGVGGRASTSGEVVPSDLWAWRKYGQKPIKGSPYPRGYYRCSSSKACTARKQVERSRTDPSMLVITYTSDHNHPWPTHRNALAGSTRPITTSSSANNKSHQHHHDHSAAAAHAAVPPPSLLRRRRHHHANNNNIVVDNNVTPSSITIIGNTTDHHEQLPKQEEVMDHPQPEQQDVAAADHDSDMLADIDGCALNILSASNFINSKKQQQHTTADDDNCLEKLPEEDDKQQLDPFSFSFFDWVDASFGVGGE